MSEEYCIWSIWKVKCEVKMHHLKKQDSFILHAAYEKRNELDPAALEGFLNWTP